MRAAATTCNIIIWCRVDAATVNFCGCGIGI
jgi:hypothetical protein